MDNPKYFIYISEAKIDILYSQIPKSLLENFAIELSIDLKPLGAGVSATVKQNQPEETRFSKLRLVRAYIEKHLRAGWVDAPEAYFTGSLPMRWGLYPEAAPRLVYFGGFTNSTILGLGGSPQHVLGNRGATSMDGLSPSILPALLSALETQPSYSSNPQQQGSLQVVEYTTRNLRGPTQNLEFLARTLLRVPKEGNDRSYILLGSPIYVALAD